MAEAQKAVIRRFFEEVINKRDVSAVGNVFAEDLVWHGESMGEIRGLEAYKRFAAQFYTAFPDLEGRIEDLLCDGDRVVARFTGTGTHRGLMLGVAPTGKRIRLSGICIYRIAGDKIVEEWWCEDVLGMLQQMGVQIGSGAGADPTAGRSR
jgi:steroid delta-isomerase-like uncharacterized protein